MAAESRTPNLAVVPDPVEAHLRREPYCFEFFQAVQLLERLTPDAAPVGHFVPPPTEAVRFAVHPSLVFPASEIQSLTYREDQPPLMSVNFMGITGPLGVLPIHYTEFIQRRQQEGDTSARDFLDLFHHRIISLFYRAWQKYHFQTTHGRGDHDRLRLYLQNLIGLGHDELLNRQVVPDDALLFHAGLRDFSKTISEFRFESSSSWEPGIAWNPTLRPRFATTRPFRTCSAAAQW